MTMVSRTHGEVLARDGVPARPAFATAWIHQRRWAALALLAAPGAGVALLDTATRHDQILAWPPATAAPTWPRCLLGAVMWAGLVEAAAARGAWLARALLVTAAAMAVGAQLYFFGRYHAYMNPRAVLVGTSMLPSVGQQLWSDRASFLRALVPPVVAALLLPLARSRLAPVSPRSAPSGARPGAGRPSWRRPSR